MDLAFLRCFISFISDDWLHSAPHAQHDIKGCNAVFSSAAQLSFNIHIKTFNVCISEHHLVSVKLILLQVDTLFIAEEEDKAVRNSTLKALKRCSSSS